ncbi:hypothetical protein HZS_408 [Henneguya salminicola]|nr:hypothetical protein HZS_408 [Henneguya salminicola]
MFSSAFTMDMKELITRGRAYIDISANLSFETKFIANTFAHELSHILGGQHISNQLVAKNPHIKGNCACHHHDEKYCVMSRTQIITFLLKLKDLYSKNARSINDT